MLFLLEVGPLALYACCAIALVVPIGLSALSFLVGRVFGVAVTAGQIFMYVKIWTLPTDVSDRAADTTIALILSLLPLVILAELAPDGAPAPAAPPAPPHDQLPAPAPAAAGPRGTRRSSLDARARRQRAGVR
jgi:hypothetical protein